MSWSLKNGIHTVLPGDAVTLPETIAQGKPKLWRNFARGRSSGLEPQVSFHEQPASAGYALAECGRPRPQKVPKGGQAMEMLDAILNSTGSAPGDGRTPLTDTRQDASPACPPPDKPVEVRASGP
jgi:hypothetical protein